MARAQTEILEWLLADRAIDRSHFYAALQQVKRSDASALETLLEFGAIEEDVALRHLANRFQTRFVSTAKLRKADIDKKVLDRLPREVAARLNVFPILFDDKTNTLSVVTADPSDLEVEQEICRTARGLRVRSYLARPAAIKAAIAKFYRGDIHAFAALERDITLTIRTTVDAYEPNMLDESALKGSSGGKFGGRERMLDASDMSHEAPAPKPQAARPPTLKDTQPAGGTSAVAVARVLVSLLEGKRGDLSGHSLLAASHAEKICSRMGLGAADTESISLAALLHDLGKGETYHLTPLDVALGDDAKTAALKRYDTPARLFEGMKLSQETSAALRHMYERFDGGGFPDRLRGTEIPLGARILALCDTFADLTSNPGNPLHKTLGTAEALAALEKHRGTVFDPNLVGILAGVVAGEDPESRLVGAQTILVVESDPESLAILDVQLTTRGFRVRTAHTADEALALLGGGEVGLVLSEVDLEPFDGFEFKNRLNASPKLARIPFFYFTARSSAADVQNGFELGAQDYLVKPLAIEIVAMKLQKFLETAHPTESRGGVAGSLKEMSIPDLVQIIAHGRKTGRLRLVSGPKQGEVHFVNGELYDALCGNLRGDDAFFALLKLRDGSFSLDPSFTATNRVIQRTAEMMLLEGLRRFDEENK